MKNIILAAVAALAIAGSIAAYVAPAQAYACYTHCNTYGNQTTCTQQCY
jgi:hypothetical protein